MTMTATATIQRVTHLLSDHRKYVFIVTRTSCFGPTCRFVNFLLVTCHSPNFQQSQNKLSSSPKVTDRFNNNITITTTMLGLRRKNIFFKDRSNQTLLPPDAVEQVEETSFDLVKINRHGSRQNRTLTMSEKGGSNKKGKSCQWYFPANEVFSIEKDKSAPCRFTIGVIRYYDFEAHSASEMEKVIDKFDELYKNHKKEKKDKEISGDKEDGIIRDDKKLTIDDFEMIKRLGKGSFSNVFLVRKKDNKQLMAMKGM